MDSQLGLEATPEEYVANLVAVFREVRRVLRDDGTLWLNLGDSYSGGNMSGRNDTARKYGADSTAKALLEPRAVQRNDGLAQKQLVGIPWRVAFALQADGWYLRSDIIWAKPNPMPESVTDRPTKAHEYLFLLSKSPRYYFDQEAVREEGRGRLGKSTRRSWALSTNGSGYRDQRVIGGAERRTRRPQPPLRLDHRHPPLPRRSLRGVPARAAGALHQGGQQRARRVPGVRGAVGARRRTRASAINGRRSRASTARQRCNTGSRRLQQASLYSESTLHPDGVQLRMGAFVAAGKFERPGDAHQGQPPAQPIPATILDPFAGSGTVGLVANRLSRRAVLIDLNPAYLEQQMQRNAQVPVGL